MARVRSKNSKRRDIVIMTEFKDKIEQSDKPSEIPVAQTDIPPAFDPTKMSENSATESKQFFDDIFKTLGLISNTENKSDTSENRENDEVDYSEYLDQDEDGKYRDKETGKVYDSIDEWKAEQETAAKRYYGAADYFEHKAKQEWAQFKSSEENGESEKEKWEHYRKSQEYYAKAKECREKGDEIMKKIGLENYANIENAKEQLDEIKTWIKDINPNYNPFTPYGSNCGTCALAVFNRINKNEVHVAGRINVAPNDADMEELTGLSCEYMTVNEIENILIERGPGSNLILGINRHDGAGHWFNAFYDGEKIYTLDGQTGKVLDWPHDYGNVSEWCAMV